MSFLAHFDAKQCRNKFQQQHFCDPCKVLRSVAFRFSFVRSLLLNLDLYYVSDPDGMFKLFLQAGGLGANI